jgi:hypothetical protein
MRFWRSSEVYAHLIRDLHAGTYGTPGFEHALHNARLIETVRRAAERGERQKLTGLPKARAQRIAQASA